MKTTISSGCISGESVSHVSAAATTVSSTPMNLLDSCFSHLLLNYLSPFSNINNNNNNNNNKVFFLLLKCPGFDFQIGFVSIKSLSGAVASVFRICWHGKTYLYGGRLSSRVDSGTALERNERKLNKILGSSPGLMNLLKTYLSYLSLQRAVNW